MRNFSLNQICSQAGWTWHVPMLDPGTGGSIAQSQKMISKIIDGAKSRSGAAACVGAIESSEHVLKFSTVEFFEKMVLPSEIRCKCSENDDI